MTTLMATLTVLLAIILVKGWIKSPTWADKTRFVMTIISIFISISFLLFIKGAWKFMEIGSSQSIFQLSICPLLIIEYLLISSTFICFIAYKKKGFSNLNQFGESGLISWLVTGFIFGLTIGLTIGSIASLAVWLIIPTGLVIWSIAAGLTAGLTTTLVTGLTIGLIMELFQVEENKHNPFH